MSKEPSKLDTFLIDFAYEVRSCELEQPIIEAKAKLSAMVAEIISKDEVITDLDADWYLKETAAQMQGTKPYHLKQMRNNYRHQQRQYAETLGFDTKGVTNA